MPGLNTQCRGCEATPVVFGDRPVAGSGFTTFHCLNCVDDWEGDAKEEEYEGEDGDLRVTWRLPFYYAAKAANLKKVTPTHLTSSQLESPTAKCFRCKGGPVVFGDATLCRLADTKFFCRGCMDDWDGDAKQEYENELGETALRWRLPSYYDTVTEPPAAATAKLVSEAKAPKPKRKPVSYQIEDEEEKPVPRKKKLSRVTFLPHSLFRRI